MQGGRLNGLGQCNKGVQPVSKAVYCSGCHDKHNCWLWDSVHTLQSGMSSLDHGNLAMSGRSKIFVTGSCSVIVRLVLR